MIKISSRICGACLIVWVIFLGTIFITVGAPKSDWRIIPFVTVVIAIVSFALSYLGGYIIRGNKGAFRLGVLFSVLWVVVSFVILEPYHYNRYYYWTEFIWIGIIPVISYLGILWIISGFLPKKKKMEDS